MDEMIEVDVRGKIFSLGGRERKSESVRIEGEFNLS